MSMRLSPLPLRLSHSAYIFHRPPFMPVTLGIIRGQTLKEYRAASKQYGAEGGITSADDRILHCCLYFAEKLTAGKVEAGKSEADEGRSEAGSHKEDKERRRLVLLSNDTMLRNKVRV